MLSLLCTALAIALPSEDMAISAAPSPFTKCMGQFCSAEIKACAKDSKCNGGITCIEKCPSPPTKACVGACIQKAMDGTMLSVGLCASTHGCARLPGRPERPRPPAP